MSTAIKSDPDPSGERCYGVDIAEDGALIVAERLNGKTEGVSRYPAGASGVSSLREHIECDPARRRICVRSCGTAAFAIALGLTALAGAEVMLVAPRMVEYVARTSREDAPVTPEERAQRLARLAQRLY